MKKIIALIAAMSIAMLMLTISPAYATETASASEVCTGLDSGKIDTTGDPKTVTITAPEGYLIDQYCVKSGSSNNDNGPVYVNVDPPQKSVTISYPGGKAISHYSVSYVVETPPDACPNMPGNQPPGTDCNPPPPPHDECPNIPGNQPVGYDCDGPPPTDVCPNIDGNQSQVPDGMVIDENGNCVTPPHDECPDMPGNQPPGTDCDGTPPLVKDASLRVHKIDGCQQRDDVWVTHKRNVKSVTIKKVSPTKRIVRAVAKDGHLFVPRLGGERVFRKVVRLPNQSECLKGLS